jgi:hypothetical protein
MTLLGKDANAYAQVEAPGTIDHLVGNPRPRMRSSGLWKTGSEVAADNFGFQVPSGAKKLNPGDIADFDELPNVFAAAKGRRAQRAILGFRQAQLHLDGRGGRRPSRDAGERSLNGLRRAVLRASTTARAPVS